jgi:hypothetical protein
MQRVLPARRYALWCGGTVQTKKQQDRQSSPAAAAAAAAPTATCNQIQLHLFSTNAASYVAPLQWIRHTHTLLAWFACWVLSFFTSTSTSNVLCALRVLAVVRLLSRHAHVAINKAPVTCEQHCAGWLPC